MRKATLVFLALGLVVASTAFASNAVRISQIYGWGGNSSAGAWRSDYIELFNNSCEPVNIAGWSVQYKSTTGNFADATTTHRYAPITSGVIPACGYFLVEGFRHATIGVPLIASDAQAIGPAAPLLNLGGGSGAIALFSDQVINRTCAQAQAVAVDLVGYGLAANCTEGAPNMAADATSSQAFVRKNGGAQDTDVNSADFLIVQVVAQTPTPVVHNSASPPNPDCALACNFGACCLRGTAGACIVTTAAGCAAQLPLPGIFVGVGTTCQPTPICAVPTTKTTWGQVKTIYR
jgi:hypothetical protein